MEFQKVIEKRQSVRSFNGEKVSDQLIKDMIIAAQQAPSWKNTQTSRYYVINSEELFEKFKTTALPGFNQSSTDKAGAYIVSTYRKNISGFNKATGEPDNEVGNGWGAYDLGLHDMLLCAKATELGLSTLIMGLRDEAYVKELLNIPEDEQVMAIIAVGYAADDITPKPGRKDLDAIAKFL